MESKWFKFKEKTFSSKKIAIPSSCTKDEAWDKTLEKWVLIGEGYEADHAISSCGLCNYFNSFCQICPLYECFNLSEANSGCIPAFYLWNRNSTQKNAAIMYMCILLAKEATND